MSLPDLSQVKGIGPAYVEKINEVMHRDNLSLEAVYAMPPETLKAKFDIPIHAARAISQTAPQKQDTTWHSLQRDAADYPARLKLALGEKAPVMLHVWGNLDLLNRPSVGFCGSRDVTAKGLSVTQDIAEQVALRGWVVVSGHARGVDTTAHRTALETDAPTIIVLAEGLDGFNLRAELRALASADNLLVVSEFPPSAKWTVGQAMQRNKTIIGLSDAMVLIEARSSGGTFNAGKQTLALDRPLFVVRFQDSTRSNEGNDYFLAQGAYQIMKNRQSNRASIDQLIEIVEM